MAQRRWDVDDTRHDGAQHTPAARGGGAGPLRLLSAGAGEVEGWRPLDRGGAAAGGGSRRVLLVDDRPQAGVELAEPLAAAGFAVLRVRRARAALEVLEQEPCDVVLVDAKPAGMTGFQLCREIRERSDVPVLFLSETDALAERLLAFDLGADDCLPRLAAPEELERRMRAVLRRARPEQHRSCLDGPRGIRLALLEHVLRVADAPVTVTPKEFDLLRLLLERRGEVLTTDAISQTVWGYETMGSRNFVEAHISRLRSKLGAAGACGVIETVRGVGYVIR